MKPGQLVDMIQGKIFGNVYLIWKTEAKLQALLNLPTSSNYSITNYSKFLVFHFFENVLGDLKW